MSELKQTQSLMKTAAQELRTANEVILQLVEDNRQLTHALGARDVAIKLASTGLLSAAELPEKVAEFTDKSAEELELEQKVASYHQGSSHRIHDQSPSHGADVSALSFIS